MIDVYRIHISKAEIASLPMDDRALLILAGHALNQISIFTKLVVFASNRDSSDPIEDRVNAALRVLYGALVETWECLRRPENQRLIGQVYLPVINTLGATAYAQLKKHFGRSRLLHALRNNFSFHFPETEMVEEAFAFVPDDEDWSWYMAEATTNSLWHSCELVIGYGAINAAGSADPNLGFKKIMGEVMHVANLMPDFLMTLIEAIIVNRLASDLLQPRPAMRIQNAPLGSVFSLPFYVEPPLGRND